MTTFFEILSTPKKLASALKAVQKEISESQYTDLVTLCSTRGGIEVSRDAGSRVRGATVYSCSRIGVRLTAHFKGVGPQDAMMWLGYHKYDIKGREKWAIRPEIKSAMTTLGWV